MIVRLRDLSKNLNNNINFYLLYGPNTGLIDETLRDIIRPNFTKNIFNYEESEILQNISNFEESILNKSFFDDEKLIIINRGSDKILESIKNLMMKNITETSIIIKTNNLEKKSKLEIFLKKIKILFVLHL